MKTLTQKEKVELYKQGQYAFPPPPVCHARWSIEDWMRYIDSYGKWLITEEARNE